MSDILIPVQVVLRLFTMANALLGRWVEGNALTDPAGENFIEAVGVLIQQWTEVFAWIASVV